MICAIMGVSQAHKAGALFKKATADYRQLILPAKRPPLFVCSRCVPENRSRATDTGRRFAMNTSRNMAYKRKWDELIEYYGARCFYCQVEIATTIDHVIPYDWDGDNSIENLVPACGLCNALASDKMFETIEQKRQYILNQRKTRTLRRAICTECLLPFTYRMHSPSMFLCAECYDHEYDAHYSETKEWKLWLRQLRAAGMPAEAHRMMKKRLSLTGGITHKVRLETLIDEYSVVLSADEDFAILIT